VDDPLGEARAQLATCGTAEPRAVAIIGAGLGYLTQAAYERFPDARIIVLEPIASLAQAAQHRTPALYASDRVQMLTGPEFKGGLDLWRLLNIIGPEDPEPALLLSPAIQAVAPAAMATAMLLVRRAVSAARMNARARRDNAGRYVTNTLRNMRHIVHGADLQRLMGQFKGVPAVLVAAGPSLDRNVVELRALQQRALIIAADTAWRPLVQHGIEPHLVVSVDPTPLNGRHLTIVPRQPNTWIAAEASVDPDALAHLDGCVATFRVGDHQPWPWLGSFGLQRPFVRVWGSVITAAFDIALGLGCDPLVFAGADLAYSHGQPYCRGTAFELDWARHVATGVSLTEVWQHTIEARAAVYETDVTGGSVRTAAHLVEFRNWIVAHAARHPGRRVVNATGAGILIGPGIETMGLPSALATHPDRGTSLRQEMARLLAPEQRTARPGDGLAASLDEVENALAQNPSAPTSPAAEWLAFGQPSLTPLELRDAVAVARAALARTGAAPKPPSTDVAPRLRLYDADRVEKMRARVAGDDVSTWAEPEPSDATTPDTSTNAGVRADRNAAATWTTEVSHLVDTLLALPHLVNPSDSSQPTSAEDRAVVLSYRFPWSPSALPWVAALEEALLVNPAYPGALEEESSTTGVWFEPSVPIVDEGDAAMVPLAVETRDDQPARLELQLLRWRVMAAATGKAGDLRLPTALTRALHLARADAPDTMAAHLELGMDGTAVPVPVPIDVLSGALTGTLVQAGSPTSRGSGPDDSPRAPLLRPTAWLQAKRDPRIAFLQEGLDRLEPRVLSPSQVPRGYSLAHAGSAAAVFVPHDTTTSMHVLTDGTIVPGTTWPSAVTGECPWGHRGGAIAWSSRSSVVHFIAARHAAPVTFTVPFTPVSTTVAGDGTVYWSARGGGLWRWTPDQQPEFLCDAPTFGPLWADGEEVVLPALRRDAAGRVRRVRLRHEWRLRPGTGNVREVRIGPEGQCTSVATGPRWTARAYPFSDLIQLTDTTGTSVLLACQAATNLAWAGDALVVTTSDGTLLSFLALASRLGENTGAAPDLR